MPLNKEEDYFLLASVMIKMAQLAGAVEYNTNCISAKG